MVYSWVPALICLFVSKNFEQAEHFHSHFLNASGHYLFTHYLPDLQSGIFVFELCPSLSEFIQICINIYADHIIRT